MKPILTEPKAELAKVMKQGLTERINGGLPNTGPKQQKQGTKTQPSRFEKEQNPLPVVNNPPRQMQIRKKNNFEQKLRHKQATKSKPPKTGQIAYKNQNRVEHN